MAKVELKSVRKNFGEQSVLSGIDLAIADREFFTLVGPSGCGKSTLLNLVAGLEFPTDGSVLFDGQDVTELGPRPRDVAMVFQNYALYPHMRVRENLSFPLEVRELPREKIAAEVGRISRLLGLEELLERYPRELSGGQQQRVALGRALIRSPRVFLMDEPLSNLDAKLRTQMRLEIKRLHQDVPITTVYVTHDQEEAMSLSDRLAILKDGVLQQCGTPKEVYERPVNLFVAQFIGKPPMNIFPAELLATAGPRASGPLLCGIRPEHLQIAGDGAESAKILVVEPLGSETWVELEWRGVEIVLKSLESIGDVGDTVRLNFPAERLHFFDTVTGNRAAA